VAVLEGKKKKINIALKFSLSGRGEILKSTIKLGEDGAPDSSDIENITSLFEKHLPGSRENVKQVLERVIVEWSKLILEEKLQRLEKESSDTAGKIYELEIDGKHYDILETSNVMLNPYSDTVELGDCIIVTEGTLANLRRTDVLEISELYKPISLVIAYCREDTKFVLKDKKLISFLDNYVSILDKRIPLKRPELLSEYYDVFPDVRVLIDVYRGSERVVDWNLVSSKILDVLRKYIVFIDERLYDFVASFIIATYFYSFFHAFPYLYYHGPPDSGKTRAMVTTTLLSYRGIVVEDPSEASIYRLSNSMRCTLGIDETLFTAKGERILSASYKKRIPVARVEPSKWGFILKLYDTYSPKVFSFVDLPDNYQLLQRIIGINMIREKPQEVFDPNPTEFRELNNTLYYARLTEVENIIKARDNAVRELKECKLSGREIEIFTPILAGAKLLGRDRKVLEYILEEVGKRRRSDEIYRDEKPILRAINNIFIRSHEIIGKEKVITFTASDIAREVIRIMLLENNCANVTEEVGEKLTTSMEPMCKKLEEELAETYKPAKVGKILSRLGFKDLQGSVGRDAERRNVYKVPWSKYLDISRRYDYEPTLQDS